MPTHTEFIHIIEKVIPMSDYPALEEMGIHSLDEVSEFNVRQEQNADVLKVYYRRSKGSLLPRSKKFTFVRPRTAVPLRYLNQDCWEQFKGSSPRLSRAIEELTRLTQPAPSTPEDRKAQFLNDVDHLEKVMATKLDEIRQQIRALD
ncbi:MAG: hypothetical protein ACI9W6_001310 [Motiliproteus sp.]|jgi:hypothetical protein